MRALGQLELVQVFRMRAAPLLEVASALEGQFVFQIPLDELVIFDEFTIEARRDGRWFSSFYGAGVHGESFLERLFCRVGRAQYVK